MRIRRVRAIGVVLQTLTASNFGGATEAAAWDFGDSDFTGDDAADFPLLKSHSQPWQAVNLARALTRFLALDGATIVAGTTVTTGGIRLDTNGLADDDKTTEGTSVPSCSFVGGVLKAQTNYNGVMVDLRLLTGGDQRFVEAATAEKTENCEAVIQSGAVEFAATLRLEISAPMTAGYPARSLTTDYALRITLAESTLPPAEALRIDAPSEPVIVAADAAAGAEILTVPAIGGTNPSFDSASDGDLQTDGGDGEAVIVLATTAMAAFRSDNLILSLALTVMDDDGETATATIRFASAPRPIDADRFARVFASPNARAGELVLANAASRLAIWHFNGDETLTLVGENSDSFVLRDNGRVEVASDDLDSGDYLFTLQLRGDDNGNEVNANREFFVVVADPLRAESIAEPMTVTANAPINMPVLTITVKGGKLSKFESVFEYGRQGGKFKSERGVETTVLLAQPAATAFDSNGVTLTLKLAASGISERATATVRFVSTPRAISQSERRGIFLSTTEAGIGDEVLAAGDSRIAIWHNGGGATEYSLQGDDDNRFDVNTASGQIVVGAAALPLGRHEFELLLADTVIEMTATLKLRVDVGAGSAADEAVRIFLDEIESGARQWRGRGRADDWDRDSVPNAYDWTPDSVLVGGEMVEVSLNSGSGSSEDPYRIYNVWQLQAIDGMSVSRSGRKTLNIHSRFSPEVDCSGIIVWRRISTRRRRENGKTLAATAPPSDSIQSAAHSPVRWTAQGARFAVFMWPPRQTGTAVCSPRSDRPGECRGWDCGMWK